MNGYWTVPCRHCKANVGQACTIPGTPEPLRLSPAHPSRMEDAGSRPDYTVVEKYREMFPSSARSAPAVSNTAGGQQPAPEDAVAVQREHGDAATPTPAGGQ